MDSCYFDVLWGIGRGERAGIGLVRVVCRKHDDAFTFEGPRLVAGGDVTEWIMGMGHGLATMGVLPLDRVERVRDNGRAFYEERGFKYDGDKASEMQLGAIAVYGAIEIAPGLCAVGKVVS
jgi:hypothetical protein